MIYYSSDSLDFSHDRLTLMGRVAGFSLGAWRLQKERLAAARLEAQKRQAALETLQQLMVTLPHHFRNANVVIGGFSIRLGKRLTDPELSCQLQMIHEASQEIEAVIATLEGLTEIDCTRYISAWETKMIDLKKELEARRERPEPARNAYE